MNIICPGGVTDAGMSAQVMHETFDKSGIRAGIYRTVHMRRGKSHLFSFLGQVPDVGRLAR